MKIDLVKASNAGRSSRKRRTIFKKPAPKYHYSDAQIRDAEIFRLVDGYYLTCLENDVPDIADIPLFGTILSHTEDTVEVLPIKQIEKELRERIAAGETPIRDDFKSEVAPTLNSDSFKEVWRTVARDHPELSRSGPKRKK